MDRSTRVDRVLPELFAELASERTPDYLEAAIERASSHPQRPSWTFLGRWIPMLISTRVAPAPRMPWRTIVILAMLALTIAASAAIYIGQQSPVPQPQFDGAVNGIVALERDGDIVSVDDVTGTTTSLIAGPEIDATPKFSPDGSKLGFERAVEGADQTLLMVANADGSGLVQATPEPLDGLHSWSFSPDGQDLLVTARIDRLYRFAILAIDGSREPRILDITLPIGGDIETPSFRPPDGRQVLVVKPQSDVFSSRGIYVVDLDSGAIDAVLEPSAPDDVYGAAWSPDGEWISFAQFSRAASGPTSRTHIVAADGSGDRVLDPTSGSLTDRPSSWSNDSTRIVLHSAYDDYDGEGDERVAVFALDPATPPVEVDCGTVGLAVCPEDWKWSPDDTQLFSIVEDENGSIRYLLADPATGTVTEAPWSGTGAASWQRVTPPA
jgi:Tol biopolymer transport system component